MMSIISPFVTEMSNLPSSRRSARRYPVMTSSVNRSLGSCGSMFSQTMASLSSDTMWEPTRRSAKARGPIAPSLVMAYLSGMFLLKSLLRLS